MVHLLSSQGEYKSSFPTGCYTREMFYIMKISIVSPGKLSKADESGRMFGTQCDVLERLT